MGKALAALLALAAVETALAQSLGEIAERERKRREDLKKSGTSSGKSYSDLDLPGSWTTWREFKSEKGGFSVALPSAPSATEDTVDTPAGMMTRIVHKAVRDKREYFVIVTDYPADYVKRVGAFGIFDEAEKRAQIDFKGQPLRRASIAWQGRPGREFELGSDMVGDDSTVFLALQGRMFLVGNRLLTLVQVLRNGADSMEMPPEFLGSFMVLPPPASPARR